jgi:hypothetical protein
MGKLTDALESKMLDTSNLRRVLFKEASLDENRKRHFKIKLKHLDSVEDYHTHECIISIKSDEELSNLITRRNIIKLMRLIEEPLGYMNETSYPHIAKIIDVDSTLSEDKNSMDIIFHVINNIGE